MDKTKFIELAEAASLKGLEDLEYQTQTSVMAHQLGCDASDTPGLENFKPTAFYTAVETGGMSGGNYMEGVATRYTVPQPADNRFDVLDDFLEEHFPNIPFMAYRKLTRVMESVEHTVREYYGNRTDYAIRILPFEALWTVLEDAGQTVERNGGLYR